ncbi:MAG: hypothetical protein FJZ59_03605 [Chlamydiae bacterium]|nr:hypothetical protein [Chlamydiota bacterium]
MKPRLNKCASFFYKLSEIYLVPLRYVLNKIIGRWMTVLTPKEYGNAKTKFREILIRISLFFVFLLLISPTVVFSILWVVFRLIGDLCLGKQNFLLLKGKYKGLGNNTFATWNVASFLPPCTIVDGVAYSNKRTHKIGEQLKEFHFVCSQEMGGAEARFISKQLKDHFAEFYTYIGKSHAPFLQSGLFFASKEPVLNVHWYPYSVKNMQIVINRSFVIFELSKYYVAMTHPDSTNNSNIETVRHDEIEQMLNTLEQFQDKPIIFCADLNIDRYSSESGYKLLTKKFPDVVLEDYKKCNECKDLVNHPYCPTSIKSNSCITETNLLAHNRFNQKGDVECLSIDFISSDKLLIELAGSDYFYDVSDHHLIKGKIKKTL